MGSLFFQITQWQHPRFHAYFPAGNSYPSILGDMLSGAIGGVALNWVSHRSTEAYLEAYLGAYQGQGPTTDALFFAFIEANWSI